MATEKLYQKDVYLKEAELAVTAIENCKGKVRIAFESTIFFPEGGGQPCDRGFAGGVEILDVKEDKDTGIVWHLTALDAEEGRDPSLGIGPFEVGKTVSAKLDWERRFDHMQMHCGEHVLSGVFHSLFGVENHGFHMGEDYMTIDMAAEDGSAVTEDMVCRAELECNRVIWENLPVTTRWFESREEANSQPVRKAIKFDEEISVVFIGDPAAPADCCACCGTHPSTTGQIGIVTVIKAESYKGMTRITLKAGRHAYLELTRRSKIASNLGQKYSCDVNLIEERIAAAEAKNNEIRRELGELKTALLKQEEEKLRAAFMEGESHFRVFRYAMESADDLQTLARKAEDGITQAAALYSEKDTSVVLVSPGNPPCGQLVKEYAKMYGGKGGGTPRLARAIFSKKEDAELFMDLIEKHLR